MFGFNNKEKADKLENLDVSEQFGFTKLILRQIIKCCCKQSVMCKSRPFDVAFTLAVRH